MPDSRQKVKKDIITLFKWVKNLKSLVQVREKTTGHLKTLIYS